MEQIADNFFVEVGFHGSNESAFRVDGHLVLFDAPQQFGAGFFERPAGEVGIDFLAGPTEILILAGEGDAKIIAADMLAQAEHDVTASAVLITTSESLARNVVSQLEGQLRDLPTSDVARSSIDNSSAIFVVPNMSAGVDLANRIAPEHLSLHDPATLREQVERIGPRAFWSPTIIGIMRTH